MVKACFLRPLARGTRSLVRFGPGAREISSIAAKHRAFLELVRDHGEGSVRFELSGNGESLMDAGAAGRCGYA